MSTNVDFVLHQWQKIDLENLKKDLDQDVLSIEQRRSKRDESHTRLKTETRNFKKELDEPIRKIFAPILTLYQTEVQGLVKMCKQAEASFLAVYQRLLDAPDPAAWLARVHDLDAQITQLQAQQKDLELSLANKDKTIQEYRAQLSGAKGQDMALKRLQDEMADVHRDIEARVEVKLKEQTRKMEQDFLVKQQHFEAERAALTQRLLEAEALSQSAIASAKESAAEALDARNRFEEEIEALHRSADMANMQLDASHARIQDLESELALCRQQLQDALEAEKDANISMLNRSQHEMFHDYDAELAGKDRELARLLSNHHALQTQFSTTKADYEHRIGHMESELASYREESVRLREALERTKDYDEIKQELAVLRGIEFGDTSDSASLSIDVLLKRKNVALESENTRLRNEFQSLKDTFEAFKKERLGVDETMREQGQLISQLEDHLSHVDAFGKTGNSLHVAGPALTATDINNSNDGGNHNADVLLNIVTSQRDRFRQRILELEGDLGHERQRRQSVQNQVDELRADNIKLYEKIRYLQSYHDARKDAKSDQLIAKYSSEYEEHISPFHEFSSRERQRRYMNLNAGDRLTLTLGKAILGNKHARLIFLIYAIVLHLLIFLVLYKYSHAGVSRQSLAETCHQYFAAHHLSRETAVDHAHGVHFDSADLHDSGTS
eukprot:m.91049 g.91049  ORF g.91049 m.91049 type:complete len:672 (+) comp14613_c0_seq1:278-2293(+)